MNDDKKYENEQEDRHKSRNLLSDAERRLMRRVQVVESIDESNMNVELNEHEKEVKFDEEEKIQSPVHSPREEVKNEEEDGEEEESTEKQTKKRTKRSISLKLSLQNLTTPTSPKRKVNFNPTSPVTSPGREKATSPVLEKKRSGFFGLSPRNESPIPRRPTGSIMPWALTVPRSCSTFFETLSSSNKVLYYIYFNFLIFSQ